jgi:hypothetical protein
MNQVPDTIGSTRQENAEGPELSDQSNVDRRLAVLEERTKPKPKTFIENVTQWGGVATFLLALLYTFPLGVWDRFFVTPEDEVRSLIIKLTDADTEFLKVSQSLPPSQMFSIALSVKAKKTALLLPDKPLVLKWQKALSAAEVELLAFQAQSIGDPDMADKLYSTALSKAKAENNLGLLADIYRMQASLFATPGTPETNLTKARESFTEALRNFTLSGSNPAFTAMTIWNWANFEVNVGSKACGYFLAQWAINLITPIDDKMATEWAQGYAGQQNKDLAAHTMPTTMCSKNDVPFVTEVNLNNAGPAMFNQTLTQPQAVQPK